MTLRKLGDLLTLAIPCATLCATIVFHSKQEAIKFAVAYVIIALLTWLIKAITFAPRPNAKLGDWIKIKWSVNDGESFPSGHTSSAFAGAVYAIFLFPYLGVCLLALASLCAYSRVHSLSHFWRDVFFGALIAQFVCGVIYWEIYIISR